MVNQQGFTRQEHQNWQHLFDALLKEQHPTIFKDQVRSLFHCGHDNAYIKKNYWLSVRSHDHEYLPWLFYFDAPSLLHARQYALQAIERHIPQEQSGYERRWFLSATASIIPWLAQHTTNQNGYHTDIQRLSWIIQGRWNLEATADKTTWYDVPQWAIQRWQQSVRILFQSRINTSAIQSSLLPAFTTQQASEIIEQTQNEAQRWLQRLPEKLNINKNLLQAFDHKKEKTKTVSPNTARPVF